ncbi:S-phase kinase-associated 2 [Paramuricea clavata]|uniref:S-phase kinase-associated 2, partial n=1 Tax=Paramuricea clavata TaxID=317549 RepID=A0A7D9JR39_PARCT|nr:S-phase kinase-associated 2 [Paramuricea clavata]
MEDSDSHSVSGTERKLDCSSTLPNEILDKIFLELPLYDVMKLNLVCKRWNLLSRSNSVWQKFVPKYPGIHLPEAETQYAIFRKLWMSSLQIGTERWFPNPLPDLVDYDTALREEESKESGEMVESKCVLYLRLNPVYPFTTDGVNTDDSVMVETVQVIFDEFGHIDVEEDEDGVDDHIIYDAKSTMMQSDLASKKFSMELVINCLESQNFLEFKKNPKREYPKLDEEGYRVNNPQLEDYQSFVDESENESREKKTRLDDKLFNEIRTIHIGKNNNFVCYFLNDGCYCDTSYARRLLVSDTSAVYCVELYGDID